jgi:hypothetical protein
VADPKDVASTTVPGAASAFHPPEYVFKGSFLTGLHEPRPGQSPVASRMTIDLYYDGVPEEHVQSWTVESGAQSWSSCMRRMFEDPDAPMRGARPLEERLWDFEKTPVACDVEPERKIVLAGDRLALTLKNFTDEKGRRSREFNRVLVSAREGTLLGGMAHTTGPGIRVFPLGTGTVEVTYKAPATPGKSADRIVVSNSCEILDPGKVPLADTPRRDTIAEHSIDILYPRQAILYARSRARHQHGRLEQTLDVLATVRLDLGEARGGLIAPGAFLDARRAISSVAIRSAAIASFTARATQRSGSGTDEWAGSAPRFSRPPERGNPILLLRDPKTGLVQHVVITPVGIEFEWDHEGAPFGTLLAFGPVDPNPAPGTSLAWARDQAVTGGDGSRHLGGSGSRDKTDDSGSEAYRWTWDLALK